MLSAVGYSVAKPIRRLSTIIGLGVYEGSRESVEMAMAKGHCRELDSLAEDQETVEEGMGGGDETADDGRKRLNSESILANIRCATMQRLFRQSIRVGRNLGSKSYISIIELNSA